MICSTFHGAPFWVCFEHEGWSLSILEENIKGFVKEMGSSFPWCKWHFEEDFENYQHFMEYEDAWDVSKYYMNRYFIG